MKLKFPIIALAAIAVPQIVFADPTSTTSFEINTRLAGQGTVTRTNTPRVRAAGLTNNNGLTIEDFPGSSVANAFSAISSVPAGGGGASLRTGVQLGFNPPGFNEADTLAKATIGDSLTFSNGTSESQVLHLHKLIDIRSFIQTSLSRPQDLPSNSSETINRRGEVFGDGINGIITKMSKSVSRPDGISTSGDATFPFL